MGIVFDYNRGFRAGNGSLLLSSNLLIFKSKEHNTCACVVEKRKREGKASNRVCAILPLISQRFYIPRTHYACASR